MKKLLVVLLALTVFGLFAFAEDAAAPAPVSKVTGWIAYGIQAINDDYKISEDAYWDGTQYTSMGISYTDTYAGFSVNYDGAFINESPRDYTAWVKPFGDIVKFSAGKLRDSDYNLSSYVEGTKQVTRIANKEKALKIDLYPVSGLSFGAVAKAESPSGTTLAGYSLDNFAFGAKYVITDIADIVGQYQGNDNIIFGGVDVKAVPNVALYASVTYTADSSKTEIWANAGTKVLDNKLKVGVETKTTLATDVDFYAEGIASYALTDKVTIALEPGYTVSTGKFFADAYAVFAAGPGSLRVQFGMDSTGGFYVPISVIIGF
jgi:hypothetical protein